MTARRAATEDARHVVVDGRRWRATDPSIPAAFRAELMDARRAVAKAEREGGDASAARARVGDAKVALGERGDPWWEAPRPAGRRRRIAATVRALLRGRRPDSSICPSDVARAIGGDSWRGMVPLVREVAAELVDDGTIVVTQRDRSVDVRHARGPVRLRRGPAFTTS